MIIETLPANKYNIWDEYVLAHPLGNIQQTSSWGVFQSQTNICDKFWILVIKEEQKAGKNRADSEKILGGGLFIKRKIAKGFSWIYSPRGPLLDYQSKVGQNALEQFHSYLKKTVSGEKALFLRIEPAIINSERITFGTFKPVSHGFQPQNTLILDLSKTEEQLLAEMKPKGRYNIKLAEKKGVKIIKSTDLEQVKVFSDLMAQTTQRDGFKAHGENYYRLMLEVLGKENATLYLAEYEGKIIAGILNTIYKNTSTYFFGASGNEHRNLMAPYLLQWCAIKDAKLKNIKYHDLLGIAPENAKKHAWAGVTDFKKKFGGTLVTYKPAQEKAFNLLWYYLYRFYKIIRK